jgi:hypothetical protein
MKPVLKILFLFVISAYGCDTGNKFPAAENAFDAGREFIDGCLKGDFVKATFYMAGDTENNRDLLQIQRVYNSKSADQRREYASASIIIQEEEAISDSVHIIHYMNSEYASASIIIQEEEAISDSVHIIHYMNSYDKIARKVKVILRNGDWQVDFKYTFDGNL